MAQHVYIYLKISSYCARVTSFAMVGRDIAQGPDCCWMMTRSDAKGLEKIGHNNGIMRLSRDPSGRDLCLSGYIRRPNSSNIRA